jgi:hypothetical protein
MSGQGIIRVEIDLAALQSRLVTAARKLAEAHAADLAQRGKPDRWRNAGLLWPLFGKE